MPWTDELREGAAKLLPAPVFEYFDQGSGHGTSAGEAAAAWESLRLRPRILRDVSRVSTATTVLGHPVATPILVAPTTLHRQADPGGEAATARAAARAGSLMCVSTNAGTSFEDIGRAGSPWWVQAYVMRDRGLTRELLVRAREAGASAVVLTADTPVVGAKQQAGPSVWDLVRPGEFLANIDTAGLPDSALDKADDLGPGIIGELAASTGLPVVVKGVLRGDDARICAAAGAAGVVVSNHGGRQLDTAIPTARALPEVADALAGSDAEVYVDGGLRRAEHVLAALALGARAVFLGRQVLWALSVGGEDGVHRLLTEMTEGLEHAMTLAGEATVGELGADLVA